MRWNSCRQFYSLAVIVEKDAEGIVTRRTRRAYSKLAPACLIGSVAQNTMPAQVFISYSTTDIDAATRSKRVLDAAGHCAYVAHYDARGGVRLPEDIKKHIEASDIFVVIWSSSAKSSDWVAQEVGIAESLKKIIVPIVLERDLKPSGFISDRKYVSAFDNLETAISELKAIVDEAMKKKEDETGKALLAIGAIGLLIAALSSK